MPVYTDFSGHATTHVKSRPCGIRDAQSSNETGFSPSTSVVPCYYFSVSVSWSLIDYQRFMTIVIDLLVKLGNPDSLL